MPIPKGMFCKQLTYNGIKCSFVMIDIGYSIDPMIYAIETKTNKSELEVTIIITPDNKSNVKGYIFIDDGKGVQDRFELFQLVKVNYRKVKDQ